MSQGKLSDPIPAGNPADNAPAEDGGGGVRRMNVYPSYTYHDWAAIIGNAESLSHLADQLRCAADHGEASANLFATDGEGYSIEILRVDDIEDREDIPLHYVAEFAGGPVTGGALPADLRVRMPIYRKRSKP